MSSVAIIFEGENNTVLLQHRDEKAPTYPGMWGLFGGTIEDKETPIECAIRETKEELGITLSERDLQLLLELHAEDKNFHVFRAKFPGNLEDKKLTEGKDMRFFSKEEISKLDNLVPLLKKFKDIYIK